MNVVNERQGTARKLSNKAANMCCKLWQHCSVRQSSSAYYDVSLNFARSIERGRVTSNDREDKAEQS